MYRRVALLVLPSDWACQFPTLHRQFSPMQPAPVQAANTLGLERLPGSATGLRPLSKLGLAQWLTACGLAWLTWHKSVEAVSNALDQRDCGLHAPNRPADLWVSADLHTEKRLRQVQRLWLWRYVRRPLWLPWQPVRHVQQRTGGAYLRS